MSARGDSTRASAKTAGMQVSKEVKIRYFVRAPGGTIGSDSVPDVMRRRTFLIGAAATLAAAGCDHSDNPVQSRRLPAAVPSGAAPVVIWSLDGGMTPAGLLALRPARLVAYRDGSAIADAAYRSNLARQEIVDLVNDLSEALKNSGTTRRKSGVTPDASAPTTVLSVRSAAGTFSARLAALEELRAKEAYSATLYATLDKVAAVHERVVGSGQPYTAERVRLVIQDAAIRSERVSARATSDPSAGGELGGGEAGAWPAAIAVPDGQNEDGVRVVDADADHAREIVRSLPRDLDMTGAWPVYQLPDGRRVHAAWRYLLPDE